MTTLFVLVRHGQTEWNLADRFRGHVDIPLNQTGIAQAGRVASRLAGEKIDAIYSSPLQRAVKTAEPIAQAHHLPVQPEDGLQDMDVGAFEGLTIEEARQAFPEVVDKWLTAPGHVKFPKGDSMKAVRTRAQKMLEELAGRHPDQTVLLVSHRVPCLVILCLVIGLDADALWNLRVDNASISRFETRDGGYVVSLVNETSHLKTPEI